jgi:hypothetical protein
LRPEAYRGDAIHAVRKLEAGALLAWGVGAIVAVLGSAGLLHLTGIAAVDALLVSGLAFLALRWRSRARISVPESV